MKTTVDWRKYRGPHGNRRRIRALAGRLEREYGPFKPKRRRDPVDELILTVLSQNTNDRNRDKAYRSLKEKFPTWADVLAAPIPKLQRAIRVGGLAHSKSKNIKSILRTIKSIDGRFKLSQIADQPVGEAMEFLTGLPGVGTKTAACVMLFSFGKPVMPVDTHVHRLSGRLGLVSKKATPDHAFRVLMQITPEELIYPFHIQLIRHGRLVCKSQRPRCGECVMIDLCPSAVPSASCARVGGS